MHTLQDKFVSIALKISLYPLALVVVNSILTGRFFTPPESPWASTIQLSTLQS